MANLLKYLYLHDYLNHQASLFTRAVCLVQPLSLNVTFLENCHAFSARPIEHQYIHVLEKLIDI